MIKDALTMENMPTAHGEGFSHFLSMQYLIMHESRSILYFEDSFVEMMAGNRDSIESHNFLAWDQVFIFVGFWSVVASHSKISSKTKTKISITIHLVPSSFKYED